MLLVIVWPSATNAALLFYHRASPTKPQPDAPEIDSRSHHRSPWRRTVFIYLLLSLLRRGCRSCALLRLPGTGVVTQHAFLWLWCNCVKRRDGNRVGPVLPARSRPTGPGLVMPGITSRLCMGLVCLRAEHVVVFYENTQSYNRKEWIALCCWLYHFLLLVLLLSFWD